MLDIETMGTEPGSSIIAIGAVEFNLLTGDTGEIFYKHVSLKSCDMIGLKCDASTILFWMKQSDDARSKFFDNENGMSINQALMDFRDFVGRCSSPGTKDVQVWGNGSRFDMGLMNEAYRKCIYPTPWDFRNERDVRTLVSFAPQIMKSIPFEGVKHDAIADCFHQIKYCSETYRQLIGRQFPS